MSVNQNDLIQYGIPPSRADIQITTETRSVQEVTQNLQELGLSAGDLSPIDWRKKADLNYVKDQKTCGDCWAQSSTAVLTDRFIIQKNIKNLNLNPVITTQCVQLTYNNGCMGGSTVEAGQFFENEGVYYTGDKCPGFEQVYENSKLPNCKTIESECISQQSPIYKAVKGSTKTLVVTKGNKVDESQTIINMKQELLKGPYCVGFRVAKDFMANKWDKTNGIYINGAYNDVLDNSNISTQFKSHLANPKGSGWASIIMEGGKPASHAVEVVGWDVGNAGSYGNVPYWIVKNSWGPNWNGDGYFKFAMNIPPHNFNKNLGLDIPVIDGGSLAGGGVSFDPDLNTGDNHGHVYPPSPQDKRNEKKGSSAGLVIGIVISLIIIVAIIIIFFRK